MSDPNPTLIACFREIAEEARIVSSHIGAYAEGGENLAAAFKVFGERLDDRAASLDRASPPAGEGDGSSDARAEIQRLKADPEFQAAFLNRLHPGHEHAMTRMLSLQARASAHEDRPSSNEVGGVGGGEAGRVLPQATRQFDAASAAVGTKTPQDGASPPSPSLSAETPVAYRYLYPIGDGTYVWRFDPGPVNGTEPVETQPLYTTPRAPSPVQEKREGVRCPAGSNADEWAAFIAEHAHAPEFLAVQIADLIDKLSAPAVQPEGEAKAALDNWEQAKRNFPLAGAFVILPAGDALAKALERVSAERDHLGRCIDQALGHTGGGPIRSNIVQAARITVCFLRAAEKAKEAAEQRAERAEGELEKLKDGSRPLPFDRNNLGRMVREAWVRWAKTQPAPKPSWLEPYDNLGEDDKEADRQIGETIARWVFIAEASRLALAEAALSAAVEDGGK